MTVRTRTGRDVTGRVPEVAPLADVLGRRCVLDGELVAGAGLPQDFYAFGGRMARRGNNLSGAVPITFVAFDVRGSTQRPPRPFRTVSAGPSSKGSSSPATGGPPSAPSTVIRPTSSPPALTSTSKDWSPSASMPRTGRGSGRRIG